MPAGADPLANVGTPVGAPPPSPVASGASDPLASIGTAVGAPAAAATTPPDITANPKGEGVYQMKGPKGAVGIPYSNVETAKQQGLNFANPNEMDRYGEDWQADPARPHDAAESFGHDFIGTARQHAGAILGMLPRMVMQGHTPESITAMAAQHPEILAKEGVTPEQLHTQLKQVADMKDAAANLQHTPDYGGFGGWAGSTGENLAEFMGIDGLSKLAVLPEAVEGAKAASQADKLAAASKVAKTLTDPANAKIAKLAALGLRTLKAAAQTGAVSGTQSFLDTGGDLGETAKGAAVGAAAGGGGEVLGGAFDALRGGTATEDAAAAAHEGAPAVQAERTAAMSAERQATAQGGVKNVVSKATGDALDRFNAAGAKVPGFTPVDVDPASLRTFGEASQQVKDAARPIYQKLNASNAYDGKLQELQDAYSNAMNGPDVDYKAADEAETGIDDLLQNKPAGVHPDEMAAAKMAWRDSKVLDKLHAATEGAFNGISEDRAAAEGTGARLLKPGNAQGGSLQQRLGVVMSTPAKAKEVYRVIGEEGVANLDRASQLVSNPELAKATQTIADEVAKQFPAPARASKGVVALTGAGAGAAVGAGVGHMLGGGLGAEVGGSVGAGAGAALADGTRMVMRKMVMSPRVGQLMDYAVRNNVTPRIAAGIIAAEIRREDGQQTPTPAQ